MASTDKKIRMTIVLERALYQLFHTKTHDAGATHNGIIRTLVQRYVNGHCGCGRPPKV